MQPGLPQAFSHGLVPILLSHCGRYRIVHPDLTEIPGLTPGDCPGCFCFSGRWLGDIDHCLRDFPGRGDEAAVAVLTTVLRENRMKPSRINTSKVNTPVEAPAKVSRRGFLSILWTALGLAALAEFFWIAFSFLRPAKTRQRRKPGEFRDPGWSGCRPLRPARSPRFKAENFTLSGWMTGGFWHFRANAPIWDAPCHGLKKKRNFYARAMLQPTTSPAM